MSAKETKRFVTAMIEAVSRRFSDRDNMKQEIIDCLNKMGRVTVV